MIVQLSQFLAAVMQALPQVFLFGAPLLVAAFAIAALLDAKLPGKAERDLPE